MEDFVPYKLAKKLKEKGFPQHWSEDDYITENEEYECHFEVGTHYNRCFIPEHLPTIAAPTISQVLKWLREEKKIHFEFVAAAYGYNVIISQTPDAGGTDYYYTHMNDDGPNDGGAWDRYEDAALYCIEYVLDNLI